METSSKLNIRIICGNKRTGNAIEMFFNKVNHKKLQIVEKNKDVDILIADLDHYQQRKSILNASKINPLMSVIYFSVKSKQDFELQESLNSHGGQLIKKPLTNRSLSSALKKAINQHKTRQTGETPIAKLNNQKRVFIESPVKLASVKKQPAAIEKVIPTKLKGIEPSTIYNKPKSFKSSNNHASQCAIMMNRYSERAYIGSLKDINFNDEMSCKSAKYQSHYFLQQYISDAALQAKALNAAMELKFSSCVISINADASLIKINDDLNGILSLAKIPIQQNKIATTVTTEKWDQIKGNEEKLDCILWQLALLAARGRVPKDTDFFEPVSLKCWPNMTRLTLFPHALRIAALWTQNSYSLQETAKLLKIEHRFIFSFYSAARAIGLIENGTRYHTVGQLAFQDNQNRGLFGKFLRHIRS